MKLRERIEILTNMPGLSAAEDTVAQYLTESLALLGIPADIDRFGNVHGRIESSAPEAKTILLEAHMDQIGLMISGVDDQGYLKFVSLGCVYVRILCCMVV